MIGNSPFKFVNVSVIVNIIRNFNYHIVLSFFNKFIYTASISLLKSTGVVSNFPISNSSTSRFKLFKLLGTFFKLSISNLFASDFKLAESVLLPKSDVSIPVSIAFFKLAFVA